MARTRCARRTYSRTLTYDEYVTPFWLPSIDPVDAEEPELEFEEDLNLDDIEEVEDPYNELEEPETPKTSEEILMALRFRPYPGGA